MIGLKEESSFCQPVFPVLATTVFLAIAPIAVVVADRPPPCDETTCVTVRGARMQLDLSISNMQDAETATRRRTAPQAQNPGEPEVEYVSESAPNEGSTLRTGCPVIVATGNKVLTQVDFQAHDLVLVRHYSAAWQGSGLFGPRWLSGFDHQLHFVGTSPNFTAIELHRPEGLTWTYDWNSSTSRWEDSKPDSIAYI